MADKKEPNVEDKVKEIRPFPKWVSILIVIISLLEVLFIIFLFVISIVNNVSFRCYEKIAESSLLASGIAIIGVAGHMKAQGLSEEEKKEQIKKLCATYSMNEELKGDGIKELYDNNEIRGVNELEGVDELKGVEELHGQKHEAPIDEALESATIETDDQTISVSTGEDGSVSLDATPKEDITFESDALTGVEDEMIAPLSDDSIDKIEAAADANSVEEGEEDINFDELDAEEPVDEFGDFEDFDEESFNGLGESYLRECYENVTGFKTTGATVDGKKLTLEGIIKFDSGNIKETEFVFESIGNGKFEGYNKHISRGKKTYRLDTSVKNNKLVCEALNYNYRSRNELNESVRVYGTIKRK